MPLSPLSRANNPSGLPSPICFYVSHHPSVVSPGSSTLGGMGIVHNMPALRSKLKNKDLTPWSP
jgi:hypothetical protein